MKKVLFYIPFIKTGGLEQVAVGYLRLLHQAGYEVDLIIDFNLGNEGNTFENEIPKGINYQFIKSEKASKFIYTLRTLGKKYKVVNIFLYAFLLVFDYLYYHIKTKKILEKGNYDSTISFYQFLPAYLTQNKSAKHIIWLHGSVEHYFSRLTRLLIPLYEKKLNKYDFIVTVAKEMEAQLKSFYPNLLEEKIKMIYNPIDFNSIEFQSNDYSHQSDNDKNLIEDDYICTVARIDENQKDIETLINAYQKLYKENNIKEKLYIIGDGQSKEYLEGLVKNRKLQNKILFLGRKNNPFIWMKHAKVFILSSKFEGFGMVLVEAMAVDTYVIGSNCKTGPSEILNQGECGDLFETGDAVTLAKLISFALSDSNYRDEKIQKARKRIKEFKKEESVNQLSLLINHIN
jgi:glycosyltransferase involved in cell wall biosynthesis